MSMCKKACGGCVLVLGAIFFVVGFMMGPWLANTLDERFQTAGKGACSAEDLTEKSFLEPYGDCDSCNPLFFGYLPFDITNVAEYLEDPAGVKPRLQEKGPYYYRNLETRLQAKLEGNFVSYKSFDKWIFEESMSNGKETDIITKMDLGYLAVTTGTGGERNFINSLLSALLATLGQDPAIVAAIPDVVKANFMRLINGLNSFDPQTMVAVVTELAPLFTPGTDFNAYMAQLATKSFIGFNYNGIFVKRSARQWAMGQPSFIAGLAIGAQYPTCAAPRDDLGGVSMIDFCAACSGKECHSVWSECSTCRKAAAIRATSDGLCSQLEAELTDSIGAQGAASVVGPTCKLCSSSSLFCLAQLPGEVNSAGVNYNEVPVDESSLKTDKQNQGCSDVTKRGEYELFNEASQAAIWQRLAPGQEMPTVFDLMQFSKQSWCDSDVQEGVTCNAWRGTDGKVFAPAGVSVAGLEEDLAFETAEVFVTQVLFNVTLVPTGEEVEVEGIKLQRISPLADTLKRVPWNEELGVGYPVDGLACLAFQKGFLSFLSRPMFLHADKSLLDNLRLFTRHGTEVTKTTALAELVQHYETFVDVQPAVGVAMNGRKRLMVSSALATEAVPGSTASTSNLVHPTMPAEVILPSFWIEEAATIPEDKAEAFRAVVALGGAMAPVLGVGVGLAVLCWVLGVLLLVSGCRQPPSESARDAETASREASRDSADNLKAKNLNLNGPQAQPASETIPGPAELAYQPMAPPAPANLQIVEPALNN